MNETKTRLCRVPDETFDFLGYTFGRCYSPRTGRAYLGTRPSAKKIRAAVREISELTGPAMAAGWTPRNVVGRLNRMLRGWANYFCLGPVSQAYRAVDQPRRVIGSASGCARSTRCRSREYARFPDEYLYEKLGLVRLRGVDAQLPVGESMSPCPRAGCGKSARPVR